MITFHHKLLASEKVGFGPMDELIHHPQQHLFAYFIRSVIQKFTIDIKYHLTLNIIFNVVFRVWERGGTNLTI